MYTVGQAPSSFITHSALSTVDVLMFFMISFVALSFCHALPYCSKSVILDSLV